MKKETSYQCPVCSTTMIDTKQRVFRCPNCGHRYRPYDQSSPVEFHNQLYRKDYQRKTGEMDEGGVSELFHAARKDIVTARVERIGQFLRKGDRVLDAGGGAGTFAMAIKDLVTEVTVSEVNEDLLAECQRNEFKTINKSLQDMPTDQMYDVVCSWHSLEHCEPLMPAALKLKQLFRRYLIIEIPKERGAPEKFDGHFQFFSDQSLQMLFDDLVVRYYDEGVQKPARLVVFEKKRQEVQDANAEKSTLRRFLTSLAKRK